MIEINETGIPEIFCRPPENVFIAESMGVIDMALAAGCAPIAALAEPAQAKRLEETLRVPVYTAPDAALRALTGYHLTRGAMCAMQRPAALPLERVCAGRRIAYLERVCDPANVGAIFRCAAALGFDGIVLGEGCADPYYKKAVRASMGCVLRLPWCRGTIEDVTRMGFFTVALALREGCRSLEDVAAARHERLAVALGNEGEGLCEATIDACDCAAKIEMHAGVDSLNVATAAAIAFYAMRDREE